MDLDPGEDLEFKVPEGGVEVPERLKGGFGYLFEGIQKKLGFEVLLDLMAPRPGKCPCVYVENPIEKLNDFVLPRLRAELDLEELAQQTWVAPFRMVLFFMLFSGFVVVVVVVLRQW